MPTVPALIGSYHPPRVRHRQRVWCEYRAAWCRITTWTDARMPWPRCNQIGVQGGSGLWVNETLRRAIETESAVALKYWFGVGTSAVWNWRKAFDIAQVGTEGSRRLHKVASEKGAASTRAKDWTDAELDAKSMAAKRAGIRPVRWKDEGWSIDELALLGTMPDEEVAKKIGRTRSAVRAMRWRKGVPEWRGETF